MFLTRSLLLSAVFLTSSTLCLAEPTREEGGPVFLLQPTWASLDGARPVGSPLENDSIERSLGVGLVWKDRDGGSWGAGISAGERRDSALRPVAGGGRVDGLHSLQLQAFHSREGERGRRLQGFFGLRGGAEHARDLGDGLAGLLWVGRDRPTSPTTRFGWGVVALYRSGDGFDLFPAPTFEWDPPGKLQLVLRGPLSELRADLSERWQLALSARVTLRRYRLGDGSLFVDRQVPLRLALRRKIRGKTALELFAGKLVGREWEVLQRPGLPDRARDVEGGTLVGFQATLPLGRLFR